MTPRDAWLAGPAGLPGTAVPGSRRAARVIFWTLTALAAAVMVGGLTWALTFLRPYSDPATSMENTIPAGGRFLVEPGAAVRRGDLVLFEFPGQTGPSGVAVKRLIGLPGDHVACCDAHRRVMVNGKPLDETYLYPGDAPSVGSFSVVLRAGQMWVLGDHRSVSYDSRGYGPVAVRSIKGRVVLIAGNGSFTFTPVRTPATFVADGLAPPDRRDVWPLTPLLAGSAGLYALLALTVFGLVRLVVRRRAVRRPA